MRLFPEVCSAHWVVCVQERHQGDSGKVHAWRWLIDAAELFKTGMVSGSRAEGVSSGKENHRKSEPVHLSPSVTTIEGNDNDNDDDDEEEEVSNDNNEIMIIMIIIVIIILYVS